MTNRPQFWQPKPSLIGLRRIKIKFGASALVTDSTCAEILMRAACSRAGLALVLGAKLG